MVALQPTEAWEMTNKVWLEMLCYGASHSKGDAHAQPCFCLATYGTFGLTGAVQGRSRTCKSKSHSRNVGIKKYVTRSLQAYAPLIPHHHQPFIVSLFSPF